MAELVSPKSSLFTLREKRVLRYIVFFVVLSRIVLMFRSEERIYTRPYLEDSFYLFNCAEHFAHGEGFTCDGKQATNGVQPLVVIFYAPLFLIAGANKLLALKLAFILIALFDVLSTLLVARLVRLLQKKPDSEGSAWLSPPIVAAFLWASLYPIFVHTGSGLETGLYSMMLLASLTYYAKLSQLRDAGKSIGLFQWVVCGFILGFTVLARIDSVFLVIAIAFYEVYKLRAKGLMSGAVLSIMAFIVSSPWWIYNYKVFGSIMPQSGVSESLESGLLAENLRRGAIVIGDIFTVFFFLPNYELPAWFHFFWFAAFTVIVVLISKKLRLREYLRTAYSLSSLTPYYFFCAAIVLYYVFFFSAPHFLPRYFQPFRIIWLVLFACVTPRFISSLRDFRVRNKHTVLAFIWIFALCAFGFSASRYGYYFLIEKASDFYQTGKYALEHPDKQFGMEQSGTAGFIASNVLNLDGKVNFAALQAIQKGDIGAYVQSARLDYIADWREFSERIVESARKHGTKFQETDSIGRIIIFKRIE